MLQNSGSVTTRINPPGPPGRTRIAMPRLGAEKT